MEAESRATSEEAQGWPGAPLWHNELHRLWGQCTLEFWLLRFREWYERDDAFQTMVNLMEEVGIGAYTAYELSGEFDVLLRAWIPAGEVNGFAERLKDTFPLKGTRKFTVEEVIRHWPWIGTESFVPKSCDPDELRKLISLAEVESANRVSDHAHTGTSPEPTESDVEALERLMGRNALADIGSTTGIRMMLRLRGNEGFDDDDWRRLGTAVAAELDRITGRAESGGSSAPQGFTIVDVSLYGCSDRSLLILCRIPYHSWHDIREHLLEPLAAIPGVMQTTMFPVLSPGFVCSREHLILDDRIRRALRNGDAPPGPGEDGGKGAGPLPPPPRIPPSAREYLKRPEGRDFEVKGSAFAPLEDWLGRGRDAPEDHGLSESGGFFRDTIGKTVVAMLNSGGGTIVIGVLELDKFERHSSEVLERLAELPVIGRYCVLGLQDPVFTNKDWDGFELKFNRLLKEAIEGEVADLVHLSRDWHEERPLAVVRVDDPGMSEGYYLRKDNDHRFYIRRGSSTDQLRGPAMIRYIERARDRYRRWREP